MKVTSQQLLDAGINAFAVQLLLESIGRIFDANSLASSDNTLEFEFNHRGVAAEFKLQITARQQEAT